LSRKHPISFTLALAFLNYFPRLVSRRIPSVLVDINGCRGYIMTFGFNMVTPLLFLAAWFTYLISNLHTHKDSHMSKKPKTIKHQCCKCTNNQIVRGEWTGCGSVVDHLLSMQGPGFDPQLHKHRKIKLNPK
jgi:hypothetical protein